MFGYPDETRFLVFDILHQDFTLKAEQVLKDIKLWSFFAQYVLFYYNEIKTVHLHATKLTSYLTYDQEISLHVYKINICLSEKAVIKMPAYR